MFKYVLYDFLFSCACAAATGFVLGYAAFGA